MRRIDATVVEAEHALGGAQRARAVEVVPRARRPASVASCGLRLGCVSTHSTPRERERAGSRSRASCRACASASPPWTARAARSTARPAGSRGVHAVALLEHGDARRSSRHRSIGEVGEDLAGIDRGELMRVADQDQRCARGQRVEQRVHQLEIDHRGFVDDHRADGQRALRVMGEAAAAVAEQAVQRLRDRRRRGERAIGVGGVRDRGELLADHLGEPVRRLAGLRGERDCVMPSRARPRTIAAATTVLPVPGPPVTTASVPDERERRPRVPARRTAGGRRGAAISRRAQRWRRGRARRGGRRGARRRAARASARARCRGSRRRRSAAARASPAPITELKRGARGQVRDRLEHARGSSSSLATRSDVADQRAQRALGPRAERQARRALALRDHQREHEDRERLG